MLINSPWEYSELFKEIGKRSFQLLKCQKKRVYLLIDEVGFRKKGNQSACVGQQYIGSIGKNDNGQVAVAAGLSSTEFYCPVSAELFMPADWENDFQRRSKTGIPESKKPESKTVMALSMIRILFKRFKSGLECVVFDALYGSKIDLLWQLVRSKIPFVGDVRGKTSIFLTQPKMKIPLWSGRGRKFYKKRPTGASTLIQDYAAGLKAKDFSLLTIRNGTKGALQAHYHKRKVWIHHEPSNSLIELHLLIRKDANGEVKYSLGFFNGQRATMLRMARAQAQRVFVERIFEEGKNILGMADYQTRKWNGFHRHIALCSLALLFLMEQKIHLRSTIGKITAYQLQELINASVRFLDSLDQTINRLSQHIPQYQRQIENQQKMVT